MSPNTSPPVWLGLGVSIGICSCFAVFTVIFYIIFLIRSKVCTVSPWEKISELIIASLKVNICK